MAAGILTAAFVLLLGVTRLMKLVYWLVPLPVVLGIQLAQGLNFAMAAVNWRRRWAAAIPSAVIVFVLGVVFAIIRHPAALRELRVGPSRMRVVRISREAWKPGVIKGAVPQIPLSVLNSVVAVCKLTRDLFPEKEASATSVSVTMGAMNLVGCWFGAMPCCHGAGGLAGQYKFGGRSGACVAALGGLKLALGLVLGGSVLRVLASFPVGLLGVLLLFAA
ncbi:molybdate transporter 1 [Hordeum vulgare]|nr:molybdate transporter 1 [Hordeum vulgare]